MGSGIIIDDGGSTRIKWNDSESAEVIRGKLENLMDVREERDTGISSHEIVEKEPYEHIRITYQDKHGLAGTIEMDLTLHTTVHVRSCLQQNVKAIRTASGMSIMLYGDEVGPIVEARQHNRMRRYIVTNSGPIESVLLEIAGKEEEIYNAATVLTDGNRRPVIYTSVVLY